MGAVSQIGDFYKMAYPVTCEREKNAALVSTATFALLLVLNILSLSKLYSAPHLAAINLGLSCLSFGCAFGAGISKIGVVKEVLHTLPIMIISLLAILGLGAVGQGANALRNMSIGIITMGGIAGAYYLLLLCGMHHGRKSFDKWIQRDTSESHETKELLPVAQVRSQAASDPDLFTPLPPE